MSVASSGSLAVPSKYNVEVVLKEKKIPLTPWDLALIESLLFSLSMMDSNNFASKASIGEREGRCFSSIVARRHYYFMHGIGRSGDLTEAQPKAAGSSVLYKLTNSLLSDFMTACGFNNLKCVLVPLSTEMTTMLCLLTFYSRRREARYVLCYDTEKTDWDVIINAGFEPIAFNTDNLENEIFRLGVKCVNCLFINSSDVKINERLLMINLKYEIPTLFYNVSMGEPLDGCKEVGQIDLIIYKDKHSIFPIDATIVSSYNPKIIEEFSKVYPGRATISSTIDTFIMLLSYGMNGLMKRVKATHWNCNDEMKKEGDISNITYFSQEMISKNYFKNLIPKLFLDKGFDALRSRNNAFQSLLTHGKLPNEGWSNMSVEYLLQELSSGSNEYVKKRHFNFVNGIDLSKSYDTHQSQHNREILLTNLTNSLLQDLFKMMGIQGQVKYMILPVATGMSLVFTMLACHKLRPETKYVVWSRIDQKSCFKSIVTAGFIPIIVDTKRNEDRMQFVTDTEAIEAKIKEIGARNIVCVISVTSCFAPRACDNIEEISELCKRHDVFHIVNNAYGLTSKRLMNRIHRGRLKGSLDIFVQSTDKNLLVPVGGAIVAAYNTRLFDEMKLICSGKVSISSTLDVFITLVSMGRDGFQKLVTDRENMHEYLRRKIGGIASAQGEEVTDNSGNPISIAMTLKNVKPEGLTQLGSSLFLKNVFGAKVVTSEDPKVICNHKFLRWGSHSGECNFPYIACAAAFGVTQQDVDTFINKLEFQLLLSKNRKQKAVKF